MLKHLQTRPNPSEQAQTTHAQPRRPAPSLPHSYCTAAAGEKVQRRHRPRTRGPGRAAPPEPPGLTADPGPAPGRHGTGRAPGHPGGPFSTPRQRGQWETRTKEKKEAATPRRPRRDGGSAAAPRSPRGATGAAGLGAASRGAARPQARLSRRGSILPLSHTATPPIAGGAVGRAQRAAPPHQPGKGTGSARSAGSAAPGRRRAAEARAARGCFRLRRGGGERVPTSPLARGRGKKGADGSRWQDGGGRRSWRGGAPRTWQQVHAGGDGGEGARRGKGETREALPANGACCAAGGGHSQVPVAREGGTMRRRGEGSCGRRFAGGGGKRTLLTGSSTLTSVPSKRRTRHCSTGLLPPAAGMWTGAPALCTTPPGSGEEGKPPEPTAAAAAPRSPPSRSSPSPPSPPRPAPRPAPRP